MSKLSKDKSRLVRKVPFPPWPYYDEDEISAAMQVLKSGDVNYWTGQEGRKFEDEYGASVGTKYAVALMNGSVALEAALVALGMALGDEVVVTSRTFIASASCVIMRGGRPVMADVDPVSQNITAETIAAALTPSTKGIVVPKMRELTMQKACAAGFGFATLVHPRTEMSKWVEIGEGTVICAGNILTTNITLGRHVQINLDCTVGHDVVMGDYATLAPGVHVSGYVHIGKRAYIGTGAVIINGTQNNPLIIGDDVIVGAGACVTKSISCGTWAGVPAKELHQRR